VRAFVAPNPGGLEQEVALHEKSDVVHMDSEVGLSISVNIALHEM
jgi:hypothetical protein